jgi:hypothetical protein
MNFVQWRELGSKLRITNSLDQNDINDVCNYQQPGQHSPHFDKLSERWDLV